MTAKKFALLLVLLSIQLVTGCHKFNLFPFGDREKARDKAMQANVSAAIGGAQGKSKYIGDYVKIGDNGYMKVQYVGIVDRLDGTGEDPPASRWRTMLLEDLKKHQVQEPQKYISSPNTALVIVTAYIPPICRKNEKIDVYISLPEGSDTTSLRGGYLMPCNLRIMADMGEGGIREGRDLVIASGPVLIDALGDSSDKSLSGHRKGVIPAGGKYIGEDRSISIRIENDYRTVRMARQLADRIGRRFDDYDQYGSRKPLAEAKDNANIKLMVQKNYRDNYVRYLHTVRSITLTDTQVEKHMRMQELSERISFGPTSELAALRLEAIGNEAVPTLKKALSSPDFEARFHASVALAYIGNTDGVPVLKEAAKNEPAFRVFALAALSALPDGTAGEALRELLHEESTETRYGAFRAFSAMSPEDPEIRGIDMEKGFFSLHTIVSKTSPMIHVSRFKKSEIVIFNDDQQFKTPLVVRAGSRILVQGNAHNSTVSIKRIAPGEREQELVVSARISDVIEGACQLGATYAEIVEMLVQAEQQRNLPGTLAIDALPKPGREYIRPENSQILPESLREESGSRNVIVGGTQPNLYSDAPPSENQISASEEVKDNKKSDSKSIREDL